MSSSNSSKRRPRVDITKPQALLAGIWLALSVVLAGAPLPVCAEKFPDVPLVNGCEPLYASLCIDPFANRPAYILFDGNVAAGYNRCYVWAPGSAKYDKPVALTSGAERKFPTLEFTAENDKAKAAVSWTLSWEVRTSTSGGKHTYFDYITGQQVTKEQEVKTAKYVVFSFANSYGYGDKGVMGGAGQTYPLDLVIRGQMNGSADAKQLPPAFAPWNNLNLYLSVKQEPAAEKKDSELAIAGRLRFGGTDCLIRSLPRSATTKLEVAPYREEPIVSRELEAQPFLTEGTRVTAPTGWYNIKCKLRCDGLKDTDAQPVRSLPFAPLIPAGL